jgi:hypothetical protein
MTTMKIHVIGQLIVVALLQTQAPTVAQSPSRSRVADAAQNPPSRAPNPALVIALLSLLVSTSTAYIQFRAHRAKKPVISITMTGLPPYRDAQARTEVKIKNVGTAATTRRLDVTVICSWMPLLSYRLNFSTASYCLEPNEEYWWGFRMNDSLVPNSLVKVVVSDSNRDDWIAYEHLNTPANVATTVQGSGSTHSPSSPPPT